MDNKKLYSREIKDLFKAKESFHRELAKMPFEEKIRILTHLQKIASNIRKVSPKKGKKRKAWEIQFGEKGAQK